MCCIPHASNIQTHNHTYPLHTHILQAIPDGCEGDHSNNSECDECNSSDEESHDPGHDDGKYVLHFVFLFKINTAL